MNFFEKFKHLFSKYRQKLPAEKTLKEWFFVTFDSTHVYVRAEPPGREAWSQQFEWKNIIRICFLAEDMFMSDGIYVYTNQRPESYVIPTEATGGIEFWSEILRRGLFDAELAVKAAQSAGGLFCWPAEQQSEPPTQDKKD